MSRSIHPSRRDFLKRSTAFGALTIVPASVVMGTRSRAASVSPNEKVRLAAIGIGNQGGGDLKILFDSGHCDVVALCDVDLKGKHTQGAQKAHPQAKRYTDFRKMFDEMGDQIDAVLVALPDHSHFCAAMLAMSLGKHVYVEKPLAHSFGECERLIALAEKSGVVTQMGNQGHSGANYFQFKAWTEAGIVKGITRIDAYMNNPRRWHGWGATVKEYPSEPLPEGIDWETWIGPAPEHPFSRKLHPQEWRSWFDYGSGAFGDWGPHILDTCHRFLKLGLPATVTAVKRDGPNPLVFPQASTIRFSFPEREGMPACDVTWYDGKGNKPEVPAELGEVKIGPPGKILYGKDIAFQGGSHASTLQVLPREKFMDMRATLPKFDGKPSNHYANFLLACKGQEEARSPFKVSGELCQVFNLGIIAQRLGGELKFDPKTRSIVGNAAAQALLDPAPRKGWEEFYKF
jgi:predicted dehydrogenase